MIMILSPLHTYAYVINTSQQPGTSNSCLVWVGSLCQHLAQWSGLAK